MKIDALLIMQFAIFLIYIFSAIILIKSYRNYRINKIKNYNRLILITALKYFKSLTKDEYSSYQKYDIWRFCEVF
ncbi:MAG: hypothetical protein N2448_09060 [Caloramator sp.]|nr:hypothetical protein [Caloramator sp.]